MKKTLAMLCVALVLLAMTACKGGNVASPSPKVTVKPAASPTVGVSPSAPMSPDVSGSPTTTGGGTIEGFKEGETVDVNALPSEITSAVNQAYSGATITAASYATYMNEQMYLLTLSGAADNTDKIYVKADGTIVPYEAPTNT